MNENDNRPPTAFPFRAEPPPVPPPLPGSAFEAAVAAEGPIPLVRVVEVLLREPERLARALGRAGAGRINLVLLVLTVGGMAAYGALVGSFSGGPQWWLAPLKIVAGLLLSALICFPSLFIFHCLQGGRLAWTTTAELLMQALALTAVLMVGFAPVAWVFSQSTETVAFMGFLHLLLWFVSVFFGLRLLGRLLNRGNPGRRSLALWSAIFVLVGLQMCTTLRPLVGSFDGFAPKGKKFFLAHWVDAIQHGNSHAAAR